VFIGNSFNNDNDNDNENAIAYANKTHNDDLILSQIKNGKFEHLEMANGKWKIVKMKKSYIENKTSFDTFSQVFRKFK